MTKPRRLVLSGKYSAKLVVTLTPPMKFKGQIVVRGVLFVALAFVFFMPEVARSDPASSSSSPAPAVTIPANATPEMTEFLQNRTILAAKMAQINSGDPQALTQFQQQNAALLQRQTQLTQTIAQQQASNTLPTPPALQIPPNAFPQLQAFLTAQDLLKRDEITFMNQHLNDTPATQLAAIQQWHQQTASRRLQLQQLAQAAFPSSSSNAMPVPPPLQMPPNASPSLQAFLLAQDQFKRDQIAFMNQHMNDDPATQAAAIQQWQQQNAARFQQIQQMAQALSNSN